MAEKDILEKVLLSQADVFADCVNALAYGGSRRFRAENMCPAPTESFYRGMKRMHNQFCDLSYYLMEDGEPVLQCIIGNETRLRKCQVLRKASYQGGAYRGQAQSGGRIYPVIGMVLDWTGKSTRIPLSLRGLLAQNGASREDLRLVDEVKLSVWHMKNLPAEIRERFTSDMGFVADFLNEGSLARRKNQKIVHVEALCEMMEALTGDARFTALTAELLERQEKGEEIIMCEYIDMLEAKGEKKGREIGKEIGKEIGENRLASLLAKLYSQGRDEEAKSAVADRAVRARLYEELCIG